MEEKNKNWTKFIQEKLLNTGFIDGLLLLTLDLEAVYKYGKLENLHQNEFEKFKELFNSLYNASKYQNTLVSGLQLTLEGESLKFVLRHLQYKSAYAITKANKFGLIVISLPFGILVASHSYPITSAVAACLVEDVVILLCS